MKYPKEQSFLSMINIYYDMHLKNVRAEMLAKYNVDVLALPNTLEVYFSCVFSRIMPMSMSSSTWNIHTLVPTFIWRNQFYLRFYLPKLPYNSLCRSICIVEYAITRFANIFSMLNVVVQIKRYIIKYNLVSLFIFT